MNNFKGTKEKLKPVYVSGVCIGIGTIGDISEMKANSILPDTDEEYKKEKSEIVANMVLFSNAYEMLQMLQDASNTLKMASLIDKSNTCEKQQQAIDKLIKEITK